MIIGVLTGGGDAPGLNPAIRAVALTAIGKGHQVIGFRDGWKGVQENLTVQIDRDWLDGMHEEGGTRLGSSRTNPMKSEETMNKVMETLRANQIDALVAIGGDDTLSVAAELSQRGVSVVGIPKTMDNDVPATDYCIGFDTSVNIVADSLDKLRTTARSHHRCLVLEVMGRDAGWVAGIGGVAGGADYILLPEVEPDLEDLYSHLENVRQRGRSYALVVVSEGVQLGQIDAAESGERDAFGHIRLASKAVGETLAEMIEQRLGWETRSVVLGHLQRGGSPSAFDRVLGTRYGVKAMDCVLAGQLGVLVVVKGWELQTVPLESIARQTKTLDPAFIEQVGELLA
ncbi:MAG: ATP-dependent 6-phosphofructokinase [Chloroflexota bacterium]|nr:ATP-dependent 6-phosphofructokinase [Chloroflexota bacterium]